MAFDIDIKTIKKYFDSKHLTNIKNKAIEKRKVIIICGPTGIGKSNAGLSIAKLFDTDIISADSMQVYRRMDIGTDKYNSSAYGIKQFMVDVFEPSHKLTVMEYRDLCINIINKEFFSCKKVPVLVGGSGLYIKSITGNLDLVPQGNERIRKKLIENMENSGPDKYYRKLKQVDKSYADKINQNDKRRIIRALEVYYLTKKPFSEFQKSWAKDLDASMIVIGFNMDRDILYGIIEKRVDAMFSRGLIDEVRDLVKRGFKDCISLKQAVGYKETIKYLDGVLTEKECRNEIKKNTRNLAKKQLTWFRKDRRINWMRVDNYDNMIDLIKDILNIIEAGINK